MLNIVIWGMGKRAKRMIAQNYFEKCHIIGFIDTYNNGTCFMEKPVYRPEDLPELLKNADFLFVANQYLWEIYEKCIQMGVDLARVIFSDNIKLPAFFNNMDVIKKNFPKLYNDMQKVQYALVRLNECDSFDSNRLIGTEAFSDKSYSEDYFRYRTFEFIANELITAEIQGAVAELGVFKGIFSRLINNKFFNKKLYLFDTFEGFDASEAEKELALGRCDKQFIEGHKDTSVEIVKANLIYPEQSVICKGLFPQSVTKEAEKESYCFVSIDVDFEDSMYAGIEFFYPRLVENGILYIHDYNTCFLEGVKKAVKRYEEKQGIKMKKIPLADRAGTLVIIK